VVEYELQQQLRRYANLFGTSANPSPADCGSTHTCGGCGEEVRAVLTDDLDYKCPNCERTPTLLELGVNDQ
jgi:bacterioferritin-associated ferredoxin